MVSSSSTLQALLRSHPCPALPHSLPCYACRTRACRTLPAPQNAIMWLCTDDERYARNVATLVDAWATTCTKFVGACVAP